MFSFLGKIIADLRSERMWSVEDLAARSKVSPNTVSTIESGDFAHISFSALIKTIVALRSCVSRPFSVNVSYAKDIPNIDKSEKTLKYFPLTETITDSHLVPFIINITDDNWAELNKEEKDGEDFVYIVSGKVEIRHGEQIYSLSEGDSIHYSSSTPHYIRNLSDSGSRVLIVLY